MLKSRAGTSIITFIAVRPRPFAGKKAGRSGRKGMAAMQKSDEKYREYVKILKEELIPATGCTEPIAIAYAAAKAREVLGGLPAACRVEVSGNIVKNAKSVVVPNTGGLKGIPAAAAAGIAAGDAAKGLEVLDRIGEAERAMVREYLGTHEITVAPAEGDELFYLSVAVWGGDSRASVVIERYHTNITRVERGGEVLYRAEPAQAEDGGPAGRGPAGRGILNVKDIVEFADCAELADIEETIERQIACNSAIAADGMENDWGANIGKVLMHTYGNDVKNRARAMAAAGSDARMGGCAKPVVIVSGSGNQGMTASLPVIEYARELGAPREKLIRAVALADLVTIHQKTGIGRLSAFCGAVCAGCGAGAGIAYLCGGDYDVIAHTIVNALGIVSGMVCDGAKPSCAAKIATAVEAGILGLSMYRDGQQFLDGDGIIAKGVDHTITNVGRMARVGMRQTDREIIKIMTGQ